LNFSRFSAFMSDMQNWFKWKPSRDCVASNTTVPGMSLKASVYSVIFLSLIGASSRLVRVRRRSSACQ
jgi:hypothetical protein